MAKSLSPLGKLIRIYRIEHDLNQKSMASDLEISAAFLSAIELNTKAAPEPLLNRIAAYMDIIEHTEAWWQLIEASHLAKGFVPIKLNAAEPERNRVAIEFSRMLPSLNDRELDQLLKLLKPTK
jgi:transcriptional regulator with XRE-family HTH domain